MKRLLSSGKRGKLAKSDAHNLWERLKIHEAAVLMFAKDPHVSFTNNRAERDLRISKVKQKVSGCFRASEYAHANCRISSYLQSMANKGYNPLIAIHIAWAGEAYKVWESSYLFCLYLFPAWGNLVMASLGRSWYKSVFPSDSAC